MEVLPKIKRAFHTTKKIQTRLPDGHWNANLGLASPAYGGDYHLDLAKSWSLVGARLESMRCLFHLRLRFVRSGLASYSIVFPITQTSLLNLYRISNKLPDSIFRRCAFIPLNEVLDCKGKGWEWNTFRVRATFTKRKLEGVRECNNFFERERSLRNEFLSIVESSRCLRQVLQGRLEKQEKMGNIL